MTDDRPLRFGAEMVRARHALRTVHATRRGPAEPDSLTDFQALRRRAEGTDSSDDFMSQDRGIIRHAPVVVEHRNVGMAQAAVFDGNLHVLGAESSELDRLQRHFLLRAVSDPSLRAHESSP